MIKESDLLDAIAECQGERNPNANTCIKLAAYYTILNNLNHEVETPSYSRSASKYDSGSEFSVLVSDMYIEDLLPVVDELMDTIQVLMPKLYAATMRKLKDNVR